MPLALQSGVGVLLFIAIAWAMSENRGVIAWRTIAVSLAVQIGLAAVFIKIPEIRQGLVSLNHIVEALSQATQAGTQVVFGYVGGGPAPFEVSKPQNAFVLGFQALPLVLVIAALSALLWHWRILKWVTRAFAWGLERLLGLSGAVGLGAAANVILGMVESPLLIRPYLERLTRSELFVLMSVGLATVAGTVIILYAQLIGTLIPDGLGQIMVASLISLPAAILIATVMVPETEAASTADNVPIDHAYDSAMDAVTKGTGEGLKLLLNIIAMLLVLSALVELTNIILNGLPDFAGAPLTLQRMLGWVFTPLVWAMGIPAAEAQTAAELMGVKTALNEFLAYLQLLQLPPGTLSERSTYIMIYALCGFANFASVGIMIGGLTALIPTRRKEIIALSLRSLVAGTLATSMTGAVVGMLY
ncbi:MAG: CNT family concentrative nucleoside transporter [Parvibaculaceae bacterium]|jgi:CNT family concentrative nucleoside transporter